ncbi:hypothetical protein FQZ97_1204960 [compost metagenome]
MQSRLHTVDDQRVARVVAALETHHAGGGFSQPVDQLALAFVTPLGPHHHYIATGCHGVAAVRHWLISV